MLILSAVHSSRKDLHLYTQIVACPYIVLAIEYLILSAAFIVASLFAKSYIISLIYAVIPFVVAAIPHSGVHHSKTARPFPFGMPSLESASFFRKFGILVWPLLALSVILCFVKGVSMFILYFIIIMLTGSAFSQSESLTVLSLEELPPKKFLRKKILTEMLFWAKLFAPGILLYIPFNLHTAYCVLLPIVLGASALCSCIYIKYACYSPKNSQFTSLFQGLCMIGYIVPFILPLTIIMTFIYRKSAINNLSHYLNVYNQ
ncbi:MAG: hypothetical protein KBS89_02475 [Bacteroidales bacterium]|nr:hypothetical protein [Candidatus Egerieousia equi]